MIDGHQYYKYADNADYTETRRLMFQVYYKQYNNMSLTDDDLREWCQKGIKSCKASDTGRAMFVFNAILDAVENCIPEKPLYQLAALMYFTLEEDVTLFDGSINDAKMEAFQGLAVDGFFLPRLLKDLGYYKNDLHSSIHAILKGSQAKLNAMRGVMSNI